MMFRDDKKLLLIESACGHYEDSEPTVSVREVQLLDLAKSHGYCFADNLIVAELLKNQDFVRQLQLAGFQNVEKIAHIEKNVCFDTKFIIHDGRSYSHLSVELDSLPQHAASLANSQNTLFQVVDKSCLKKLSPAAYKLMVAQQNRNKARLEQSARTAKDREQLKNQRKIQKAKKLLEEAGVTIKE